MAISSTLNFTKSFDTGGTESCNLLNHEQEPNWLSQMTEFKSEQFQTDSDINVHFTRGSIKTSS